jgi:hypothetical protein
MDPREAKAIMSQGAIRPETARDREERRVLEDDLATSPLTGKPLQQRLRNFRPGADSAIRALGGPALWMRRLRTIENEVERHEAELGELWLALAENTTDAEEFAHRWFDTVRSRSFAEVNELIDRHNRYFPAEARLPMDPRTRDFVKINGRSYERKPLDEQWILERCPADLSAARRAA